MVHEQRTVLGVVIGEPGSQCVLEIVDPGQGLCVKNPGNQP